MTFDLQFRASTERTDSIRRAEGNAQYYFHMGKKIKALQ